MPPGSPTPEFPPQGGWGDLARGFLLPFSALRLILRSRKLLALSSLCAALTLAALAGLVYLLVQHTGDLVGRLLFEKPASWYGAAFWQLVAALVFLLIFAVGANTLPLLLLAPLQDPLSEATEELCGAKASAPFRLGSFLRGAWVSLHHNLSRILLLLLGHLLLLPLLLVPGAGSAAWTLLGLGWTLLWIPAEYLDGPMTRHHYRFGEVLRAVRGRLGLCFGFGAAVYLMLWIPLLNLFFLPVAIVAGTLLFRGLQAASAIAPPKDRPSS